MLHLRKSAAPKLETHHEEKQAEQPENHEHFKRMLDHGTYGVMSSHTHGKHTDAHNIEAANDLHEDLKRRGFHPIPATGMYTDANTGKQSVEHSHVFFHPNPHVLRHHMRELAEKHHQQSYIIRHAGKHHMFFDHGTDEHPYPHHLEGETVSHPKGRDDDRTIAHLHGDHVAFAQDYDWSSPKGKTLLRKSGPYCKHTDRQIAAYNKTAGKPKDFQNQGPCPLCRLNHKPKKFVPQYEREIQKSRKKWKHHNMILHAPDGYNHAAQLWFHDERHPHEMS